MQKARVYADHHATTPLHPEVLEAMLPWLGGLTGNPSSVHEPGRLARRAVEEARALVASAIGASPAEVVFTSGGTESDTLAVVGGSRAARRRDPGRTAVLFSAAEHAAVREGALSLAAEGFRPVELPVDRDGRVRRDAFSAALGPSVGLVSVVLAGNETGVLEPGLADLAGSARASGALVHTDAVQAVGKAAVDVAALGVDLLSLSAHKLGGPKGAGALYVRSGVELAALQPGGGQEKGRRGGTEDVPAIVGLGASVARSVARREAESARLLSLRTRFEQGVRSRVAGARVVGEEARRLPTCSAVTFPRVDAETLVVALDLEGVAASVGSACSSGTVSVSRVLLAMGLPPGEARSTVRFSFGWTTTAEDVEVLLEVVPRVAARVERALAP